MKDRTAGIFPSCFAAALILITALPCRAENTVTLRLRDTTPCDVDASGRGDAVDLALMLRVLTDPAFEPAGNPDCTQDGILDGQDIAAVAAGITG